MELPYVAGLFDGEGCIRIDEYDIKANATRPKAYRRTQLRVMLNMTHFPTIRALYDQFGGMITRSDGSHRRNPRHAIRYDWTSWSGQAAEFLEQILPFMIAKREQAKIAILFQKHIRECDPIFRRHHGVPPTLAFIRRHRTNLIAELQRHKLGRFDIPKNHLKSPSRKWPYAKAKVVLVV